MSIVKPSETQASPFRISEDVLDLTSMREICQQGRAVVLSDGAKSASNDHAPSSISS